MPAAVEIHELTKRFRNSTALDGVCFSVETPGLVGLVGKNGAGKTTLLSVLAGVMRPSSGNVTILGCVPDSVELIGRIGVLMQDAVFRRGIPVLRQLVHMANLSGIEPFEAERQVRHLLDELGGNGFAERKPSQLSYGQRKRLGIIQALLGRPKIVLLDEPTAGLDPVAAAAVRELILRHSSEALFILSSHNLYEIQDVCTRVLVIDKGKLVGDADIAALIAESNTLTVALDRPGTPEVVGLLLQLPEITDIIARDAGRNALRIHFATTDVNALQLRVQEVLNQAGFGVVRLTRERALADGIRQLVNPG